MTEGDELTLLREQVKPGPTFNASTLPEKQREHFYRNLRVVEQVLARV